MRFYEVRLLLSLSERELADLLHISVEEYVSFENETEEPSLELIRALAVVPNISADYILELEEHPVPPHNTRTNRKVS